MPTLSGSPKSFTNPSILPLWRFQLINPLPFYLKDSEKEWLLVACPTATVIALPILRSAFKLVAFTIRTQH